MTRRLNSYRPRDANGWIVPQVGTVSRAVYECLRSGILPEEIYRWICYRFDDPCNIRTLRVMIHRIKNPGQEIRRSRRRAAKRRQLTLDLGDRP
jgi:hypothetical protein